MIQTAEFLETNFLLLPGFSVWILRGQKARHDGPTDIMVDICSCMNILCLQYFQYGPIFLSCNVKWLPTYVQTDIVVPKDICAVWKPQGFQILFCVDVICIFKSSWRNSCKQIHKAFQNWVESLYKKMDKTSLTYSIA